MGKRVLLLNASHNDIRLLLALRKLGCYVITSGNNPSLPGHKMSDKYIQADYSDKDLMLSIARKERIDAVCPCGNDFGVTTAAYVAEKLKLPGHDSYEAALVLHHKDKFCDFAQSLDLPMPWAIRFANLERAYQWADNCHQFPFIVKPADLSAGNGVGKAERLSGLKSAIGKAFAASRTGNIVIAQYIDGPQFGFCSYLVDRRVRALATNGEHSFINPWRVEADTFPGEGISPYRSGLVKAIEKMAAELRLVDGIFHMQARVANGKVYILECMRRVLGNIYGLPAQCHNEGFNWDYWEAAAKCGFSLAGFPREVKESGFWAYRALIAPKNGEYISFHVPESMKPYLHKIWMLKKPGEKIERHMSDPIGFLFFSFDTAERMREIILERQAEIEAHMD